jgi:hypothetical protein
MKTVVETPAQRAAMLPEPQVGVSIVIPLDVWPAYMALHRLEPLRYRGWGSDGKLVCVKQAGEA